MLSSRWKISTSALHLQSCRPVIHETMDSKYQAISENNVMDLVESFKACHDFNTRKTLTTSPDTCMVSSREAE